MRWCILPAHTHSQIRLDLTNLTKQKFKSARGRYANEAQRAVELVFSPRSKQFTTVHRITDKAQTRWEYSERRRRRKMEEDKIRDPWSPMTASETENWLPSRRENGDGEHAVEGSLLRGPGRPTHKIKLPWFKERATPRARTLLNTRRLKTVELHFTRTR